MVPNNELMFMLDYSMALYVVSTCDLSTGKCIQQNNAAVFSAAESVPSPCTNGVHVIMGTSNLLLNYQEKSEMLKR